MAAEHTALLYCCETPWLFGSKVFHSVFEMKEEMSVF
jgi:hypothetical protein